MKFDEEDLSAVSCPITGRVFLRPVSLDCGHTFESEAVIHQVETSGDCRCAICREPFTTMSRNFVVEQIITNYFKNSQTEKAELQFQAGSFATTPEVGEQKETVLESEPPEFEDEQIEAIFESEPSEFQGLSNPLSVSMGSESSASTSLTGSETASQSSIAPLSEFVESFYNFPPMDEEKASTSELMQVEPFALGSSSEMASQSSQNSPVAPSSSVVAELIPDPEPSAFVKSFYDSPPVEEEKVAEDAAEYSQCASSSSSSSSLTSPVLSSSPNTIYQEQIPKLTPTTGALVTLPAFIITVNASEAGPYTVACFAHSSTDWVTEMKKFVLNLHPSYKPSASNKISDIKKVDHRVKNKFETNNFKIHVLQGDQKAKKQEILDLKPSIILVFDSATKGWKSFMENQVKKSFNLSVLSLSSSGLRVNPSKQDILPGPIQVGSSKAREYGNQLLTEATQFLPRPSLATKEESTCLIC